MTDAIKATEQDIEDNRKEREDRLNTITDRMAKNREESNKKSDEELAKEQKRKEVESKIEQKHLETKRAGVKNQEDANAADKKAKEEKASINYGTTDSLALLKQSAAKEGSAFIKDPPKTAAQAAEAAKTGVVTDAAAAKEALKKVATDGKASEDTAAAAGTNKTGTTSDGKTTAPVTQESLQTLLAELNTKMGQLVKYTAQTTTNTYEQVVATKGLSGNLYKS